MNVSAIHLMCRFMTLCVTDLIWGVCCYSYTPAESSGPKGNMIFANIVHEGLS